MGQIVEWSESVVCLIFKSNYIAEKMDAKWLSTAQNPAAPKVAIMVISIQFTYNYDTPMKLLTGNEAQVSPTGSLCWSVGCEKVTWNDFIIVVYNLRSIMSNKLIKPCIYLIINTEKTLILWNIITI